MRWQEEVSALLAQREAEEATEQADHHERDARRREEDAEARRKMEQQWRAVNERLRSALGTMEQRARQAEEDVQLAQEEARARRLLDQSERQRRAPAAAPDVLWPAPTAGGGGGPGSGRIALRDDLRKAVDELAREVGETSARLQRHR